MRSTMKPYYFRGKQGGIADAESTDRRRREQVCQLIEKLVDWDVLGMEVVAVAENGIEALEKIKEFHPDIVITDIRMPGI